MMAAVTNHLGLGVAGSSTSEQPALLARRWPAMPGKRVSGTRAAANESF